MCYWKRLNLKLFINFTWAENQSIFPQFLFLWQANICIFLNYYLLNAASLAAQMLKNLPAMEDPGSIPWRREWQPSPVFFPGEVHGQRSLVGYSPWVCKESDTAKRLTLHSKWHGNIDSNLEPLNNFKWTRRIYEFRGQAL